MSSDNTANTAVSNDNSKGKSQQRKKKTYPVVFVRDEESRETQPSIADTLIEIIQANPDIKAPIRKKKADITVADVVGAGAPSAAPKKKTIKKNTNNTQPVLENIESRPTDEPTPETVPANDAIEVVAEPIANPIAEVPKPKQKRVNKKKNEPTSQIVLENIESRPTDEPTLETIPANDAIEITAEPIVNPIAEVPKPKQKRVNKKKNETNTQPVLENIESRPTDEPTPEPAPANSAIEVTAEPTIVNPIAEVPKPKQKRVNKKKNETTPQPVLENIESRPTDEPTPENIPANSAIEVVAEPIVNPIAEVPKPKQKRVNKKKNEPTAQIVLENIESRPTAEPIHENYVEDLPTTMQDEGPHENMQWFIQQEQTIRERREPILATFADTPQELVEELYQMEHYKPNAPIYNDFDASLQPIDSIISTSLETDNYSDIIMVESFEFNGQLFFIDAQNRLLDQHTLKHIGQFHEDTFSITLY
jgi:hypothetical protein